MTYINHTNLLIEIKHDINQLDRYNYICFTSAVAIKICLIFSNKIPNNHGSHRHQPCQPVTHPTCNDGYSTLHISTTSRFPSTCILDVTTLTVSDQPTTLVAALYKDTSTMIAYYVNWGLIANFIQLCMRHSSSSD